MVEEEPKGQESETGAQSTLMTADNKKADSNEESTIQSYDLKGKMYAYAGDMWRIVDKSHDLYLQVGLNTGILSLLAMLVLFFMYLGNSVRLYCGVSRGGIF